MASRLRGFLLSGILTRNIPVKRNAIPTRTVTFSENGGILPQPPKTRFGVMKVLMVSIPFLYFGAIVGKEGAAFMEENDIFVPDDDDDD